MEFNILKSLDSSSSIPYQHPLLNQLHSPFQSKDFVNPGIGGSTRIYDVFVPIYYQKPPYCSTKLVDQQGFGETKEEENNSASSSVKIVKVTKDDKDDNATKEETNEPLDESPDESEPEVLNQQKRKLLGEDVFEAFMHPVFKTSKISLQASAPKKIKTEPQPRSAASSSRASFSVPPSAISSRAASSSSTALKSEQKIKEEKPVKSSQHKFKIV